MSKNRQIPVGSEYERTWNFRLDRRAVLRCCFSFSENALFVDSLFQMYFDKAKEAFDRHNIQLTACPLGHVPAAGSMVDNANPAKTNIFPIGDGLDDEYDMSEHDKLMRLVEKLHPHEPSGKHLHIIYYPLKRAEGTTTSVDKKEKRAPHIVIGTTTKPGKWPPFVLLDPRAPPGALDRDGVTWIPRDGLTLAHEIGHAAQVPTYHNGLDNDTLDEVWNRYINENHEFRPIMSYVSNRNRFNRTEVVQFLKWISESGN